MYSIERTKPKIESAWLISVTLLSLPSLICVILNALYVPGILPTFLGFVVTWAMIALTGVLSSLLTLAACVTSAVATLQDDVSPRAKIAMWGLVSLSLLACVYLSTVRP